MSDIRLTHNIKELERDLSNLTRQQLPYALSRAINDTGQTMLTANTRLIAASFDRPTRWTLGAFWFRQSRKTNLEGRLERKTPAAGRHYLEVQEAGGAREKTGMEKALASRLPYAGIVGFVVPARRAPRDGNGNLPRSELQRIFSQTQSQRDARNNETAASRKRKRPASRYFVPKPGQLSPGIWRRAGQSLRMVLKFNVAQPTYGRRFDYYRRAEQVAERFMPRNLAARLAEALRTRK